jgi:hypothetical protein
MEILEHIKPFGSPGAHAFREELIAEVELRLNRYHEGAAEDVLKKRGI